MSWLVRLRVPSSQVDAVSAGLWSSGTTGIADMGTEEDLALLVAGFKTQKASQAAAAEFDMFKAVSEKVTPWPTPDPVTVTRGGVTMEIDAGRAFGHGTHPTTELALDLLLAEPVGGRVLDVGCGTGILAIAAALAGADTVVAIDNDPVAIERTTANAARNGATVDVSDVTPAELQGLFDVVVVNMLPVELQPLAGELASRLSPGGKLVVSGFLGGHQQRIADFFPTLRVVEVREHGDWGAIHLA